MNSVRIGIEAPSDWYEYNNLETGLEKIRSRGHEVICPTNLRVRVADFMAGTVEQRLSDLGELCKEEVGVIWVAEGGYAAPELRHGLDKMADKLVGKWLVGYSDATVLHLAWHKWGGRSLYAPNICGAWEWTKDSLERVFEILEGVNRVVYEGGKEVISGETEGKVLAVNLETFCMSLGTIHDPLIGATSPIILGLEEYRQDWSVISRQLEQILDHVGFEMVVGIVLGRFSQMREEGYPLWAAKMGGIEGLLAEKLARRGWSLPVWRYDTWGHDGDGPAESEAFHPIVNGANSLLTVSRGWGEWKMEW